MKKRLSDCKSLEEVYGIWNNKFSIIEENDEIYIEDSSKKFEIFESPAILFITMEEAEQIISKYDLNLYESSENSKMWLSKHQIVNLIDNIKKENIDFQKKIYENTTKIMNLYKILDHNLHSNT